MGVVVRECQEILEDYLPWSTVPVYPAYGSVVVVGGQNAIAPTLPIRVKNAIGATRRFLQRSTLFSLA